MNLVKFFRTAMILCEQPISLVNGKTSWTPNLISFPNLQESVTQIKEDKLIAV